MMKYLYTLLVLTCLFLFGCERDDICTAETGTTPRLTIAFYSAENPEQLNPKNVFNCRVQGIGNEQTLPELSGAQSRQVISLPLKTTDTKTQYSIYNNYEQTDAGVVTGNEDIITISYITEQVYVSRACGFKTVFKNINITVNDDGDKWIKIIQSVNDNQILENENATNFNIFH
ncbi:DUF6452 family protein [Bizionia sediminis]|uniref:DUF6452 family protein n=1 Tax=Bizionia sediminis TaxID=1737064 RepID=A0ABW5KTK1_9FLAO